MNCSEKCMLCFEPQKYKVNFSKYHGLCKDHAIKPFALQTCGMCGSEVSILMLSEVDCIFCRKYSSISYSTCSHNICELCFNRSLKCDICARPSKQCDYCLETTIEYSLHNCGHSICNTCASKESGICHLCEHTCLTFQENNGKHYGSCNFCLTYTSVKKPYCEEHLFCSSCLLIMPVCLLCQSGIEDKIDSRNSPNLVIVNEEIVSNSSKQDPYDEKKAGEEAPGEANIPDINKVMTFALPIESPPKTASIYLEEIVPVQISNNLANIKPVSQSNRERRKGIINFNYFTFRDQRNLSDKIPAVPIDDSLDKITPLSESLGAISKKESNKRIERDYSETHEILDENSLEINIPLGELQVSSSKKKSNQSIGKEYTGPYEMLDDNSLDEMNNSNRDDRTIPFQHIYDEDVNTPSSVSSFCKFISHCFKRKN